MILTIFHHYHYIKTNLHYLKKNDNNIYNFINYISNFINISLLLKNFTSTFLN